MKSEQLTFEQILILTAAVLTTLLLFLAFFFRYQITPLPGGVLRLDRLTSTLDICGSDGCIPLKYDPDR